MTIITRTSRGLYGPRRVQGIARIADHDRTRYAGNVEHVCGLGHRWFTASSLRSRCPRCHEEEILA